ncbi:MAG: hydroxymethylbilane synthase [Alphaproteobacteria bacterium]
MQTALIRIGTRRSPLALAQANEVSTRLVAAHGWSSDAVEIVPMQTGGDAIVDRSLADFGGKGLFTEEIEAALTGNRIDIAVHSAKDLPTELPDGLALRAVLPREDVRDAFLSSKARSPAELPVGAIVGTSSLRRKAMVLRLRPDLKVVEFRGNVATRMRKLEEGIADATMLAVAGLNRLGLADKAASILGVDDFLPAVGQGVIAIEARREDERVGGLLAPIDDVTTAICLSAERAFLSALDGSCRTPIGGLAAIVDGRIGFRGIIVTPDGRQAHEIERDGTLNDAETLGRDAGDELARRGGSDFFGDL